MRESELLAHIYARSGSPGGGIVIGPGDDTAVVRTPRGDELLLTVDQLIAGRHFRPPPVTPIDLIARKAIARNLSDIAAMAGTPTAALAAAAVPDEFRSSKTLFDALADWADRWECPLIGGDISGTPGPLALTVTVIGRPHPGRGPVLRSTAVAGDAVFVTGAFGGSLGEDGLGHHLTFEPRLREAAWLADTLGRDLTAMIDVSDGLGIDAGRIAAASRVRLELEAQRIPVREGVAGWERAIAEGEDHELCFTVATGRSVPRECPLTGTPIVCIGRVVAGQGCVAILPHGAEFDVSQTGWDHGRSQPGA